MYGLEMLDLLSSLQAIRKGRKGEGSPVPADCSKLADGRERKGAAVRGVAGRQNSCSVSS